MNYDHEALPQNFSNDLTFSINASKKQNTPLLSNKKRSQGYSLSFTNATSHAESSDARPSIFSSKARCIKKWRFSPKTFTFQITVFQILIYMIISFLSPNEDANACVVYRLGAKYTPAILTYHHFHRLFLPIFLHFNLQHLLGNMFFQLMWGFRIEQALGTKKFIFLYFVAALGGNLLSAIYELFMISAGASSSILGILGFGFPYVILNWNDPKNDTLDHFFSVFTYIGTLKALIIGAEDSDNAAHRGGFITGFLIAGIFIQGVSKISFNIKNRIAWLAFLLLMAFFGVMISALLEMPNHQERAAKEANYCASILNW